LSPSSSWLNLVERWFGESTSKRIRCGCFPGVEDLEQAITEFMAAWNENPKPFVWTATVESIVKKLSHCRQTLEQIRPWLYLDPDGANRNVELASYLSDATDATFEPRVDVERDVEKKGQLGSGTGVCAFTSTLW
jgi:hypothetical protein